jgi:hypothetical protein
MLAAGQDQRALIQLAILQHPVASDIERYFEELLVEIGMTQPDKLTAARLVAMDMASRIISGEVSAIRGALEMRDIARIAPQAEPELDTFYGLSSEWEDDAERRDLYDGDIIAAARRYLANHSG